MTFLEFDTEYTILIHLLDRSLAGSVRVGVSNVRAIGKNLKIFLYLHFFKAQRNSLKKSKTGPLYISTVYEILMKLYTYTSLVIMFINLPNISKQYLHFHLF